MTIDQWGIIWSCRYIAVCHPIRHRAMVHSHCITKRVCFYTGPVVALSLVINVTKFLETKVVTQQSNIQEANGSNVSITTYKIDITELRYNVYQSRIRVEGSCVKKSLLQQTSAEKNNRKESSWGDFREYYRKVSGGCRGMQLGFFQSF